MLKLSIDLTKLGEMAESNHGAITTSQSNGKQYLNATVWINDHVDEYGNVGSVQVWDKNTNTKDYVGNLRESATQATVVTPTSSQPTQTEGDGLPF